MELRATIKVAHEAQRSEWSDKKRRIRNRVCQSDTRERCYRGKVVAETIGPIYRRTPRAESFSLVAGRRCGFHVGCVVDGFVIDADTEPNIGVAKSIHEAIGSLRRGSRGSCGRFINEIDREANVGLEVSTKVVTECGVRLHHKTRRI